jgi:deazaflavin-dependent oxidoreductase (nitroreductase family)
MPTAKDSLKDRLTRYRQITISVIGRKSGRKISIPVWFVLEGSNTLHLLPVQGSDTQWYKNVLHNPQIRISARSKDGTFRATPITDPKSVRSVVEAFRAKYGAEDVKKYYSKFDAAVHIAISRSAP